LALARPSANAVPRSRSHAPAELAGARLQGRGLNRLPRRRADNTTTLAAFVPKLERLAEAVKAIGDSNYRPKQPITDPTIRK
jgi:hypothetical protein